MSHPLGLLARLRDFWLKRDPPTRPPFRLWIDITSRCNLACPACPQRLLPPEQRREMDPALLASLVEQVGPGQEVNLFHRGEALLHPQWGLWAARFRAAGARVRLHTNATLLNRDRVAQVLAAGPEIVTLSIDSLDPAAYASARRGADLGRTLAGVERLLAARRSLGKVRPRVGLLLMGPATGGDAAAATNLARLRVAGLDRVVRRTPHNWGGAVGQAAPLPARPAACTFPWYGLAVLSDGRVSPCPQDFFGRINLGDAGRESLAAIWRGERLGDLRRAHAGRGLGAYPVCAACDRVRRPTFLGLPTEHLPNLLAESIVSPPARRGS